MKYIYRSQGLKHEIQKLNILKELEILTEELELQNYMMNQFGL